MPTDLTCRCVPANTTSVARSIAAVQSNVNSLVGRVTDLEETTEEHDARITALEDVQESAFTIVDTEAELDAALLTGKHILLRGEGNGGVIEVTTQKDVVVPGTRIWGYGYNGGSDSFSKIKGNFAVLPAYGGGTYPTIFHLTTGNLEFAGFDIQGRDSNDASFASYNAFLISPAHDVENVHIHDLTMWNIHRAISKLGYEDCSPTRRLVFERNKIYSVISYAVGIQQSLYDSVFLDNDITLKLDGGTVHVGSQGFGVTADVVDCLFAGNKVKNAQRMGMEFTSVAHTAGNFEPMLRNRYLNNTILDCGSMGISLGFNTNAIVDGNIVDGAVGFGIESSAGSTLGQSNSEHNARITNNTVRNVTGTVYANGIAVDKTVGDVVQGNVVENIASNQSGASAEAYCRGILVFDAKRPLIQNNNFNGVDGIGCYVLMQDLSALESRATIENNRFYVESSHTKARYSVYVYGARCIVRLNSAWEPSGGSIAQEFKTGNIIPPSALYPGFAWTADVSGTSTFEESNLRLTY